MAIDFALFIKNRQAFPPEELARYAGQWIAWAPDGASIVASSAESPEAVFDKLVAAGHDPAECCTSYVPGENDVFQGAFIVSRMASQAVRSGEPGA